MKVRLYDNAFSNLPPGNFPVLDLRKLYLEDLHHTFLLAAKYAKKRWPNIKESVAYLTEEIMVGVYHKLRRGQKVPYIFIWVGPLRMKTIWTAHISSGVKLVNCQDHYITMLPLVETSFVTINSIQKHLPRLKILTSEEYSLILKTNTIELSNPQLGWEDIEVPFNNVYGMDVQYMRHPLDKFSEYKCLKTGKELKRPKYT